LPPQLILRREWVRAPWHLQQRIKVALALLAI
jgi:hypothetical protein